MVPRSLVPYTCAADLRHPNVCSRVHLEMTEQMFELARRTFDTPEFRGITCIEVEALGDQQGVRRDAVRLDDQPVPRLHPRVRLLLRAADPHLSGHGCRPRLRNEDRGEGQ